MVNCGIHALVPLDAGKRKGARPGWDGGLYAFMRRVLATDAGEAATDEVLPLGGEVAIQQLADPQADSAKTATGAGTTTRPRHGWGDRGARRRFPAQSLGIPKGMSGQVIVNRQWRPLMATDPRERAARGAEAATERIRELNEQILERIKSGGESALEAYERTLKTVADYQEAAGQRGAEWVTGLAQAQAQFTRQLASASPAAARELGKRLDEVTDAAARQARRVPGEPRAEGAVRGAAAREQDLPIASYDDLSVKEIDSRLPSLSEVDLGTVEAYERKHKKRKTILQKIESLRNARD
jgi:hypothetical protein